MNVARALRFLAFAILSGLAGGCASVPRAPGMLPNALSSFVVWSEASLEPARSAGGEPVDVIPVRGGEVLRIQLRTADAVRVGERILSGQGFAETWTEHSVEQGVLLIRASAFARALLLPRGLAARAYRGHGSDPGYHWFELEDQVLAWANGPLPAPFPEVAPRERLNFEAFAEIDRVLAEAASNARDRGSALAAARAIRTVVGLRSIRALRPVTGLPYFLDSRIRPSPGSSSAGPPYRIDAGTPLELPATGPAILHIWVRSPADAPGGSELTLFEGARLRARTRAPGPTQRAAAVDGDSAETLGARFLVHVPPGFHQYRLESTKPASVTPLVAEPIVHLEDASKKDEARLLDAAHHACDGDLSLTICALSLALMGKDSTLDPTVENWGRALAATPESARRVAIDLAQGGPLAPTLDLERRAGSGDAAAHEALGHAVSQSVDDGTRIAWVHGVARGTEWRVAESDEDEPKWTSVAVTPFDSTECPSGGLSAATDVGRTEGEYQSVLWQGVPVVEFLVRGQCDDPRPVQLSIDGERLTAAPSATLVHWRVRVRGARAKVQRIDDSSARVLALRADGSTVCGKRFDSIRAPALAAHAPVVGLASEPGAAGLELWLRDGASQADVTVTSSRNQSVRLTAPRQAGVTAYDASGVLWTRVARLPLPPWASGAVRITGGAEVAVRSLVRVSREPSSAPQPRESVPAPVELDEAALVDLTRQILAQAPAKRGALYLQRALLLAAGNARRAALADARAAKRLAAFGPQHGDPVELVQAALRRHPSNPPPLPTGVNAYGIESDFEPGAQVCQHATEGPRAQLEQELDHPIQKQSPEVESATFDPARAARAVALSEQNPLDPRSEKLSARALAGSRWKLRQDLGKREQRVRRRSLALRDGPVDPGGNLRARLVVGERFAAGSYATVLTGRPAKALLAGVPAGAAVRVDIACAAREPAAAAEEACPVSISLNGRQVAVELGIDGQGTVRLPETRGQPSSLVTELRDEPGDWVALVRLVVDRPLPNTVSINPGQWAFAPHPTERRVLIEDGAALSLDSSGPSLLRVDARAEGSGPAMLVVVQRGQEQVVAADGSPHSLPLPAGGSVLLRARGGALSLGVAERVPNDQPMPSEEGSPSVSSISAHQPKVVRMTLDVPEPANELGWALAARRSPPPLTPLQASLGTLVAETGVVSGSLRQTAPSNWSDAYAFNLLGYRRRVESLDLWTRAEVFSRTRMGEPTLGAAALVYEDLSRLHLRLTASVKVESQQVAGTQAKSWLAHGFVEYSYRASPTFFVLPRIGYDWMNSSVARRPTTLAYVDDEVYSPYRARRPTFLFAQALLWYAPYFNEIAYLRLRGTFDAKAQALSHSAAVLGMFVAFGDLDLSGQAQAIWYLARDSLSNTAHLQALTGVTARYSFWSSLGSIGVTPGIAAASRPQDASWQVTAFLNFTASFRRGLRDFSSLELDFPEQLSGGIPWRGETPGAYR